MSFGDGIKVMWKLGCQASLEMILSVIHIAMQLEHALLSGYSFLYLTPAVPVSLAAVKMKYVLTFQINGPSFKHRSYFSETYLSILTLLMFIFHSIFFFLCGINSLTLFFILPKRANSSLSVLLTIYPHLHKS